MRRIILLTVFAALVGGCGTTSDVHQYQPANGATPIPIYGKWQPEKLRILVYAGDSLISTVNMLLKDSNTSTGHYKGWDVITNCRRTEKNKTCRVLFDGTEAAILQF